MRKIILLCMFISINCAAQNKIPENFEKSTVKLGKVPFDSYKGTIEVKVNRSDSSSATVSIPVQIIKSPSKTQAEPVYWMGGGPGSSNFSLPSKDFLANHDFVLIGYRGVDGFVFRKSRQMKKAMRGLNNDLFSDESLDNLGEAMEQYLNELIEDGIDINHFTMIDVIDDFEEVRKMLGHEKIILYSASYGTRVALLYSYRYPESIKRSFMVGVNPPGHCIWYPENSARIILTYDSIYKDQSGIVNMSIEECIRKSFEKMPKRWTLFKLDAGKIKAATFFLMFGKNTAVMAFDAYRKAALKGDYSGLYLMQLAYNYVPGTNYGDAFCKAVSADLDPEADYRKMFQPDNLEIGAPGSLLYWGANSNWPIKLIGEEYRKVQMSNTQTLLISGNLDITNPPQIATEELLPFLSNGKQVILKDMAHCGDLMNRQGEAYKHMALKFMDEGVVDTSLYKHDPVNFEPEKKFNRMAKWFYPVVFILSLIR